MAEGILTGRKILVTGATGYLGSWMAELARRAGNDVRLLVRRVPSHLEDWARGFEVVSADIRQGRHLADACRGRDLVWHTASLNETRAEADLAGAIETNAAGTARVFEASLAAGAGTVVKFSTFHVYGPQGTGPLTESARPAPIAAYGVTNLMGDEAALYFARRHGVRLRIPRMSNGYGAPLTAGIDRWSLVLNDLTRSAFEKREIVLRSSGLGHRDFVSIPDIFDAVCRISAPDLEHEVYHVGGGGSRSILEVARLVQKACRERLGEEIPIRAPAPAPGESEAPVDYDIGRIRALGYAPRDRMAEEIHRILDLLEGAP